MLVDEVELISGQSKSEPRMQNKQVSLKADTFDWWIPVGERFERFDNHEWSPHVLRISRKLMSSPEQRDNTGSTFWPSDNEVLGEKMREALSQLGQRLDGIRVPDDGDRRMWERRQVKLDCDLRWQGNQLSVSLRNRPEDRNFTVYVVVEERLWSGQTLHTAQQIPINGQLTFVPKKFLDAEIAAMKKRVLDAAEAAITFGKDARPGQPGPVEDISWIRPGDFTTDSSLRRLEKTLRLDVSGPQRTNLADRDIEG